MKAASRQPVARLDAEVAGVRQWASLAGRRGVPEAEELLNAVAAAIQNSAQDALKEAELLFEAERDGHTGSS